jgi:hypothetical protein
MSYRSASTQVTPEPLQIRMVAGFAEVIEREGTLVAEACNHPNCLVLPFSFPLVRIAA